MDSILEQFQEEAIKAVKTLRLRQENGLSTEDVISLCFDVIEYHQDDIEKCRAAVILSGVIYKGLGTRVQKFLSSRPELPARVHEVLEANVMRMECF